LIAIFWWDRAY